MSVSYIPARIVKINENYISNITKTLMMVSLTIRNTATALNAAKGINKVSNVLIHTAMTALFNASEALIRLPDELYQLSSDKTEEADNECND